MTTNKHQAWASPAMQCYRRTRSTPESIFLTLAQNIGQFYLGTPKETLTTRYVWGALNKNLALLQGRAARGKSVRGGCISPTTRYMTLQ